MSSDSKNPLGLDAKSPLPMIEHHIQVHALGHLGRQVPIARQTAKLGNSEVGQQPSGTLAINTEETQSTQSLPAL
jgi:hypothetical protein